MQHQQCGDPNLHGAVKRGSRHRDRKHPKRTGTFIAVALLVLTSLLLVWAAAPWTASQPAQRLDPDLGVPIGEPLRSVVVDAPPIVDGVIDAAWEQAPALTAPLHHGLHGDEPAGEIELRSLYDETTVYFLARWRAETPGGEPDVWRNLATAHWRLEDSGEVSGASTGSDGLACTVGCHTATTDGQGGLVGIRAETIPPGLDEDLLSGGGWSAGEWLLEWSRPRISTSPYDQNLTDPTQSYRFFIKLFLGLDGRADPISDVHELRLGW
jgi:hypothetical protein